jgi:hypothetical protein
MGGGSILAAIAVIIIIVIIFKIGSGKTVTSERMTSYAEPPQWTHNLLFFPLPRTMGELRAVEQVRTLDNMLNEGETVDSKKRDEEIARENEYIRGLPRSTNCDDKYEGCPVWASKGECIINPEYMLYDCPKSCEACALNSQEKYNVTYIYNKREPPSCVYHGEDYPSVDRYIHDLHMMTT